MTTNSEIYLIGLAILIFLIIVFLYIRKISNSSKLKLRIEDEPNSLESSEVDSNINNQQLFEYEDSKKEQELAILNLISIDRSMYDIEQIFGFLSNYGAKINNKFFSFNNEDGMERFRVINALNPGTFENDTKTFAIAIVADLMSADDPLDTVKQMVEFSINFADKFHASLCDEERTPITKQMISHMESRAQDVARIKQLSNHNN
jgi:FtsZ-interacting cell division protein ZipA